MKSDIEIAQRAKMKDINEIAEMIGLDSGGIEPYGHYKAKISNKVMSDLNERKNAKLVLVTAINPTPLGEGKTTISIGLADAIKKTGKKVVVTLREPSLGPVFGIKGGRCRWRICTSGSHGRYKLAFYRRYTCNNICKQFIVSNDR